MNTVGTQELRDMIENLKSGLVDADDVHNSLLEFEVMSGLPVTVARCA